MRPLIILMLIVICSAPLLAFILLDDACTAGFVVGQLAVFHSCSSSAAGAAVWYHAFFIFVLALPVSIGILLFTMLLHVASVVATRVIFTWRSMKPFDPVLAVLSSGIPHHGCSEP